MKRGRRKSVRVDLSGDTCVEKKEKIEREKWGEKKKDKEQKGKEKKQRTKKNMEEGIVFVNVTAYRCAGSRAKRKC